MPRIPKRLLALSGLAAAGGAAFARRRRAQRPATPAPSAAPTASAAPNASAPPAPVPPPPDAPGPSVNPTGGPASDTERAEAAEALVPPPPPGMPAEDALVEAETAAAAAEAGAIGGRRGRPGDRDPAMDPVYEAGGGEAEGFELAEEDLIENASHGGGRGDPSQDAFTPEREADEATAVDGEADREHVTEREDDRR
jgi:hypothetical protein